MKDKKKFHDYVEDSEYANVEYVESTENNDTIIGVSFTENATYEITQFVCEQANEYDFRAYGVVWDGGIVFIKENSGLISL